MMNSLAHCSRGSIVATFVFPALLLLVSVVGSIPINGIARGTKSDLILVNRIPAPGHRGGIRSQQTRPSGTRPLKVPAGEALDLFHRFGFLSLSVRVVPRVDAGAWLIREPTTPIFQRETLTKRTVPGPNQLDPQFQVFLCDDASELLEAYFRDFTAEGIQQPHKLFTGSWLKSSKSKNLGLSKQAFDGESGFVLVKLTKTKSTVQVSGTPSLKPEAEQAIRQIQVGNPDSVKEFTKEYGSHYIKDVVVGEMLYQVFALTPDQYANAKAAYYSAFSNPSISNGEFGSFYRTYLTPLNVRETGQIGVASGDIDVFRFTDKELSTTGQFGTHPNIFQLRENPALISPLESLTSGTSAIIGLNLASLRSWVPSAQAREYYDKIIDTQAALWESNL